MSAIYLLAAALLVLTLLAGLVRIVLGPTDADRMLAAQLFGTTGVAALLLLSYAKASWSGLDVALVFALLAVVAVVAFMRGMRATDP